SKTYIDADLWVSPDDVKDAEEALIDLGFEPTSDESGLPEWWLEHGSSWRRGRDGGKVDLHRRLHGVGVRPAVAWTLLHGTAVPHTVGGVEALRLSDPALAFHVALHAAHHNVAEGQGIPHLNAGVEALDETTWLAAWQLAQTLAATDMFCTGLRMTEQGTALAQRLGIPEITSATASLHAGHAPRTALGFEQLASSRFAMRPAILLRKTFPPSGFIRHWWPPAARNRRMLLVGYLYRPLWLMKSAPAGYRAWRAARRKASSSP
ncbi:MAG: nucleotidyltransferase family protein, partial [Trebonia sp.]